MEKKILHPLILLLGFFLLIYAARGQDPNYSQWLNAPLYYNPAYAGVNTGLRARFSYRDQWPSLPVDFRTCYFSADFGDRRLPGSGGIGLLINKDNEGIGFIRNLSVGLAISVRIPITSYLVSQVGIKGVMVQKWLNWNDFVFSDQLSEKYGNIYTTSLNPPEDDRRLFPDFGVGGLLQFVTPEGNISGTAGFSVDHIFQPDESFLSISKSPLPRKYVGHVDLIISLGEGPSSSQNPVRGFSDPWKINPGILYQNQNGLSSLQIGINVLKFNMYLGAYLKTTALYGSSTSLMLLAGYRYLVADGMALKFMYSYDMLVAGNIQGAGGAHEISLFLEFKNLRIFSKAKTEECPAIEQPDRKLYSLECSPF